MSELERILVKPTGGARVRFEDPMRGFIPDLGASVALSTYYRRRIRDGDLEVVKPAARKTPKKD